MSLKHSLHAGLRQDQQLMITSAMQNAFLVLQLPVLELAALIEREIDENPLMERLESAHEGPEFFLERIPAAAPSLYETLMGMITPHLTEEKDRELAREIIGNIDAKGFYTEELFQFHERQMLALIQEVAPAGIAAKNAQDSLLIQLERLGKRECIAYEILRDCYHLLLHQKFGDICKIFKLSQQELNKIIERDIQPLDPFPGLRFCHEVSPYIVPDVMIDLVDHQWTIEINTSTLPKFHVNIYEEMFDQKQLRSYLAECNWLERTLKKREHILLSLSEVLVQVQGAYLAGATSELSPITMRKLAEDLGFSETTMHRAISDKYILAPRGLVKLRSLFTHKIRKGNGESISNQTAKNLLIELVEQESKKSPLSDEALAAELKKRGIRCARRTIAKYRKELKISRASLRKRS